MSEQPPSVAPATSVAATVQPSALVPDVDDIDGSLRQIEHVPSERPVGAQGSAQRGLRDLRLAHQKQVGVIRRQGVVERRLNYVARSSRPHDPWRDDDGKVGLVLLIRGAAEQRAEHRDIPQPRELLQVGLAYGLQQTSDHEALAVTQLNGRVSAPNNERRDGNPVSNQHRMIWIDLAHFRLDHDIDQAILEDRWREGETDTVLLVVDGNRVE